MKADEVHNVVDALAAAGCPAWISGGWGVDALVGHQTRPHRDLDLAIPAEHEAAALQALGQLGYIIETDWRPVRVELMSDGRGRVDLHPLTFDGAGDGHQAGLCGRSFHWPRSCFITGAIAAGQSDASRSSSNCCSTAGTNLVTSTALTWRHCEDSATGRVITICKPDHGSILHGVGDIALTSGYTFYRLMLVITLLWAPVPHANPSTRS